VKNLVCVFAHPDDEAFGPGGTIAKYSQKYNVYILCATKGEAGLQNQKSKIKNQNYSSKVKGLGEIRAEELRKSAKILGVKKVFFLGFKDGTLSNNIYHKLAAKIKHHLLILRPSIVLTYEPLGVSGHIDHITVSMVTMFVVKKLKFIRQLWQVCLPDYRAKQRQDYYICFSPGYKKSEIDKVVNIEDVWDRKVEAMRQHKSQYNDFEKIMKWIKKFPKKEYFLVRKLN